MVKQEVSHNSLRRQLCEVEEGIVRVHMGLCKVWDGAAGRHRVKVGGVWLVEASCVLVEGEVRWVLALDELPVELSDRETDLARHAVRDCNVHELATGEWLAPV